MARPVNTDEIYDWDKFFNYCESLIDPIKFNNIKKWMDRKGYTEIEKYKESIKKGGINGRSKMD